MEARRRHGGTEEGDMEEADEEVTVLINLENIEHIPDLKDIQILELDSACPYVQVAGMIFQGKYKDSVGTHLLLEKSSEGPEFQYRIKTEKELNCKKVVVLPKTNKADNEKEGDVKMESNNHDVTLNVNNHDKT